MPQTCSVCKSSGLSAIDKELISGSALRNIAERYHVSLAALFRHKQSHLPQKLALAKQHKETLSAENLLTEMADLKDRLRRGVEQAEKQANPAAFCAFAREFRQTLESYFAISEKIAQNARVSGGDGTRMVIEVRNIGRGTPKS